MPLQITSSMEDLDVDEPQHEASSGIRFLRSQLLKSFWNRFSDFFTKFKNSTHSDGSPVFPNAPTTAIDVLQPEHPVLPENTLCLFVSHAAGGMRGLSSPEGKPQLSSVRELFMGFCDLYDHHRSQKVDRAPVLKYISQTLRNELELPDARQGQALVDLSLLRAMISTLLSPTYPLRHLSIRLQIAAHLSATAQHLLRVGACHPPHGAPRDQHRPLLWGDLSLVLTLLNEKVMHSIVFKTPNGKTARSQGVEVQLYQFGADLLVDPVFWLEAAAVRCGAWPKGVPLENAFDPAIFQQARSSTISLRFDNEDAPVFGGTEGSRVEHLTTTAIFYELEKLSRFMGLRRTVQTHAIRASAACWLAADGASTQDVQDQLAHKRASFTYERYTAAVTTADSTAAIHGTTSNVGETLAIHPLRVDVTRASSSCLHEEHMLAVCSDEELLDKAVACDEALRSLKIPAAAFSASQKATMQTLYDAAAERYAKLYLGYSRGRAAKDSLDYFPSAEEAQFSASAALDFMARTNFTSGGIRNLLLDTGMIDEAAWLEIVEKPLLDEEEARGLVINAMADDAEQQDDDGDDATGDTDDAASDEGDQEEDAGDMLATPDFRPLATLYRAASDGTSLRDALMFLATMPKDDRLTSGFRPGHAPVDGKCPFCHKAIGSILTLPAGASEGNKYSATQRHVNKCAMTQALAAFRDEFEYLYPPRLSISPTTGKPPKKDFRAKYPDAEADHVVRILQTISNQLSGRAEVWTCFECNDKPQFTTLDGVRGHLVLPPHSIVLPSKDAWNSPNFVNQTWTVQTSRVHNITRPTYFWDTSSYIVNPRELNVVGLQILERLQEEARDYYGIRRDLQLPDNLDEYCPGELKDCDADSRFALVVGRYQVVEHDLVCFVCSSDESLSPATRTFPHNSQPDGSLQLKHVSRCLVQLVKTLNNMKKNRDARLAAEAAKDNEQGNSEDEGTEVDEDDDGDHQADPRKQPSSSKKQSSSKKRKQAPKAEATKRYRIKSNPRHGHRMFDQARGVFLCPHCPARSFMRLFHLVNHLFITHKFNFCGTPGTTTHVNGINVPNHMADYLFESDDELLRWKGYSGKSGRTSGLQRRKQQGERGRIKKSTEASAGTGSGTGSVSKTVNQAAGPSRTQSDEDIEVEEDGELIEQAQVGSKWKGKGKAVAQSEALPKRKQPARSSKKVASSQAAGKASED